MKVSFKFFTTHWDWVLCVITLMVLALFLVGHDLFGMNGYVAGVLGLVGGLVLPVVLLIVGVVLAPLFLLVGGLVTMVLGLLTGLFMLVVAPVLGFVVGAVVVPLVAFITGSITALLGWLATTWLGALVMPVVKVASPFVMQYGPWLAFSKNAAWLYGKVKGNKTVKKVMAAYFKGRKEGAEVAEDVAERFEQAVDVTPKKAKRKK